jgi:flagellar biosynthetic protein FliP
MRSTKAFVRHYAEMVAAMFLGMLVLGLPAEGVLRGFGSGFAELESSAPAVALAGMGVVMTVPMVGWMRYRGHGLRPNMEMAASMLLPTLGVIGLLWAGVVEDMGTLWGLMHVVMLPSMLVAMLLRFDEYAGHHHGRQVAGATA